MQIIADTESVAFETFEINLFNYIRLFGAMVYHNMFLMYVTKLFEFERHILFNWAHFEFNIEHKTLQWVPSNWSYDPGFERVEILSYM